MIGTCSMKLLKKKENFRIHKGDCIPHMWEAMPKKSIDFSVFSPPFPSLFSYTNEEYDIGNSEDLKNEARIHLSYFFRGLVRVLKPGRVAIVHVMQIPRMKRIGGEGLFDFRGLNIRLAERAGLIYEADIPITKNPQAQAIRTKSRELQFTGLESDRAKSRPALNDYLIKLRAPGKNEVPINSKNEVTRNEWIQWAEGVWTWKTIKESGVLNVKKGRGKNDTKHICPLQLGVIHRLVRLYSNPGEIVFSPFAGIGSEGYEALKLGRRFYGCEIKDEYYKAAIDNCEIAVKKARRQTRNTLLGT